MNAIKQIIARLRDEPVLVTQAVTAVLGLAAVFGFAIPAATAAPIMALAQVVAGLIARNYVTPVSKTEGQTE